MNLMSSVEAAEEKGVTRQAIVKAMERGDIDGHRVGQRSLVVVANKKYQDWRPNPVRQAAGRANRPRRSG